MKKREKSQRQGKVLTGAGKAAKTTPRPLVLEVEAGGPGLGFTPSPNGRLRHKARAAIDQALEIRAEKVAALKEAIRLGTYRPEARKIARKMIEELILDQL
jgi:flagellar biosynthesis anti-sigma factor FlgM